ncbi:MAG: hypothetical protein RL341_1332 [Pseudomonadota bacterium]|jgi:hypothetical protein
MRRKTDLTPDPFDAATKAALRDAPLPAPPTWLDAQITAAAHDQAKVSAGQQAQRKGRGLRAPWLKFALPTLAVATLLVSIWLPQTEVNQEGITLPESARVAVPAPPPVPAPAPAPGPAPSRAAKPAAPKPPVAREVAPSAAAKERPPLRRAQEASDAVQFSAAAPAPAPAPATTVFAEEKAVQEQARRATDATAERTADVKTAPPVLAAGAPQTERARGSVMTAAPSEQAAPAPQLRTSAAMNRTGAAQVTPSTQGELESIRVLIREGKRDEATKRLLALKEREPQLEIPVDLRELIPRP